MPPPPPPSKSYMWKFADSDSDGDDDTPSLTATTISSIHSPALLESPTSSTSSNSQDEDDEEVADDDAVDSLVQVQQQSKSKRKQRKRTKKRSKNKTATVMMKQKCFGFDSVQIRYMDRCLGEETVPSSGSWPLGLSDDVVDYVEMSVHDYEDAKQARLLERMEQVVTDQAMKERLLTHGTYLETRQWDYRSSSHKNPLFHVMAEPLRMKLLLHYSSDDAVDAVGSSGPSPPSPDRHTPRKTRARSGSLSGETRMSTRQRSGSITTEQFNETFSQLEVHRVRNDLEQMRNSRSKEGSAGCACRKLTVYILPPGGGGKKAHHKRMNVADVKRELRKRHLLPDEIKTREELELLLHEAVEEEGCCSGDDCFCARNNINCQMDACDCWLPSHQTKDASKKDSYTLSSPEIEKACGNRNGMYAVDLDAIHVYRTNVLASMKYCQEITTQ